MPFQRKRHELTIDQEIQDKLEQISKGCPFFRSNYHYFTWCNWELNSHAP